jgi:hypothetical protein
MWSGSAKLRKEETLLLDTVEGSTVMHATTRGSKQIRRDTPDLVPRLASSANAATMPPTVPVQCVQVSKCLSDLSSSSAYCTESPRSRAKGEVSLNITTHESPSGRSKLVDGGAQRCGLTGVLVTSATHSFG